MDAKKIEKLLELIGELVDDHSIGTWQDKRDRVLEQCTPEDKTALSEFAGWFDEEDE